MPHGVVTLQKYMIIQLNYLSKQVQWPGITYNLRQGPSAGGPGWCHSGPCDTGWPTRPLPSNKMSSPWRRSVKDAEQCT